MGANQQSLSPVNTGLSKWNQRPYLPIISAICYNALFAVTAQCASIWVAKRVRWIPPRLRPRDPKLDWAAETMELIFLSPLDAGVLASAGPPLWASL